MYLECTTVTARMFPPIFFPKRSTLVAHLDVCDRKAPRVAYLLVRVPLGSDKVTRAVEVCKTFCSVPFSSRGTTRGREATFVHAHNL